MASTPVPVPDDLSRPFWEAARRHELVVQRCRRTGERFHPPQPLCPCCACDDMTFEQVSGRGRIHSWVRMWDPRVRGFEDRVPYVNVWVELEEQPYLLVLTELVGPDRDDVAFDAPVEVTFQELTDDITLPQFRLVR